MICKAVYQDIIARKAKQGEVFMNTGFQDQPMQDGYRHTTSKLDDLYLLTAAK